MSEIALFISHSAADAELAKLLVNAVEKALAIPASQIRFSSGDGYRFGGGVDTDEVLRAEIFDSRAFLALLTPRSLESTYVLFEIGARWGAAKRVFPLLACGATAGAVDGPLAGLNVLNASSPPQLFQLLEDLEGELGLKLQPIAAFSEAVQSVATAAAVVRSAPQKAAVKSIDAAALTDDEIVALLQDWMGKRTLRENTSSIYYADVEAQVGVPKLRLAKLLEVAARKFNYVVDRQGETLILFKQLPNRRRSS